MNQIHPKSQSKIDFKTLFQDLVLGSLIATIVSASFYIALVKSIDADEQKVEAQAQVRAEVVK